MWGNLAKYVFLRSSARPNLTDRRDPGNRACVKDVTAGIDHA
jgi:hypothetical protein